MFNGLGLLRAECLRVFGDVKNYWFNYLLGNLNVFFMFFGLFFTFSKNQGTSLDKLLFLFGLLFFFHGFAAPCVKMGNSPGGGDRRGCWFAAYLA